MATHMNADGNGYTLAAFARVCRLERYATRLGLNPMVVAIAHQDGGNDRGYWRAGDYLLYSGAQLPLMLGSTEQAARRTLAGMA